MHGSPGDYAWGPQGLDNIISRLLANLEDTGPPPTDKEKLEALPAINVTADDLQECKSLKDFEQIFCTQKGLLFLCTKFLGEAL